MDVIDVFVWGHIQDSQLILGIRSQLFVDKTNLPFWTNMSKTDISDVIYKYTFRCFVFSELTIWVILLSTEFTDYDLFVIYTCTIGIGVILDNLFSIDSDLYLNWVSLQQITSSYMFHHKTIWQCDTCLNNCL